MGYNSAHVIIGDQSEKRYLTPSEASPQHRWCFAEQLVNIGEHRRWIPNHRRYYHIVYASPMFTRASPMYRRCIADVSGTFLTLVYIAECSPTARRCSAIYRRWYLASKHREKISMHALKFFSIFWCLGEAWRLLAYVADHSPNHWCMAALSWRCPNLCIARASGG